MEASKFVKNLIFVLNILLALLIIFGSSRLMETGFGRSSLVFGFLMLLLSVILKFVQKW